MLDVEHGELADIRPLYWQTDTAVSNKSWGYIKNDTFKTPEFIVHQLIDIVSKNGNLLLNIGPRSDGTIPSEVQQVLRDIGSWLQVNGEAIYGTRPWKVFGEGPTAVVAGPFHDTGTSVYTEHDFRFTTRGSTLYALQLSWPREQESVIQTLGATGQRASERFDRSRYLVRMRSSSLNSKPADCTFEFLQSVQVIMRMHIKLISRTEDFGTNALSDSQHPRGRMDHQVKAWQLANV